MSLPALTTGGDFTTTDSLVVAVQPLLSVTVSAYTVLDEGHAVGFDNVESASDPDHAYVYGE